MNLLTRHTYFYLKKHWTINNKIVIQITILSAFERFQEVLKCLQLFKYSFFYFSSKEIVSRKFSLITQKAISLMINRISRNLFR